MLADCGHADVPLKQIGRKAEAVKSWRDHWEFFHELLTIATMTTLLFDIDGTLIHTGGAGGAALRSAFRDLFQVPRPVDVEYSGRTDRAIGSDMLDKNAIENSLQNWTRLRTEYLGQLPGFLPRCHGRILPGIEALLEQLSRHNGLSLGLLTGNLREGARLKLEFYRLMNHFRFGGYGDDHFDRNHVAESAVAAARDQANGSFDPNRVWVIGDTPLDVRCARWIGARVLAVATGAHSREELACHQPDRLVDDLTNTDQILSWLT